MSRSTLALEGIPTVGDPASLPAAVVRGFGAARACGCGPMPIRRACIPVCVGNGELGCDA